MEGAGPTTSVTSTWSFDTTTLDFDSQLATRATRGTRAWDRVPQASFAHKGRKVWKRPEKRVKTDPMDVENNAVDGESQGQQGAKRQRLKQVPAVPNQASKRHYAATLHDQVMGTPKRKVSRRKSLRKSILKRCEEIEQPTETAEHEIADMPGQEDDEELAESGPDTRAELAEGESDAQSHQEKVISETLNGHEHDSSAISTPKDIDRAIEEDSAESTYDRITTEQWLGSSSAAEEDLDCEAQEQVQGEFRGQIEYENMTDIPNGASDKIQEEADGKFPDNVSGQVESGLEIEVENEVNYKFMDEIEPRSHAIVAEPEVQHGSVENDVENNVQNKPQDMVELEGHDIAARSDGEHDSTSPISLDGILRQERPVNPASPAKRPATRRSSRRISKRLSNVETNAEEEKDSFIWEAKDLGLKDVADARVHTNPSEQLSHDLADSILAETISMEDDTHLEKGIDALATSEASESGDGNAAATQKSSAQDGSNYEGFSDDDSLHQYTTFSPNTISTLRARDLADSLPDEEQEQGLATEGADIDDATIELNFDVNEVDELSFDSIDQSKASPPKRTRSGARFSDDTSILKDFLNRAQAKKIAQALQPVATTSSVVSPRRSPRKILGTLDSNSPSPTKSRDIANRPGTPPGKQTMTFEETDETMTMDVLADPNHTTRRSGRTRKPSLTKPTPSVTSFIPVRRADGHEPVVLQRSEAQKLARITKTNTDRNEQGFKMPKYALKAMAKAVLPEEPETVTKKSRRGNKTVKWDEALVYFQEEVDVGVSKREKPKVRRSKAVTGGSANGTSVARRKLPEAPKSNGTPSAKRRGRSKELAC